MKHLIDKKKFVAEIKIISDYIKTCFVAKSGRLQDSPVADSAAV